MYFGYLKVVKKLPNTCNKILVNIKHLNFLLLIHSFCLSIAWLQHEYTISPYINSKFIRCSIIFVMNGLRCPEYPENYETIVANHPHNIETHRSPFTSGCILSTSRSHIVFGGDIIPTLVSNFVLTTFYIHAHNMPSPNYRKYIANCCKLKQVFLYDAAIIIWVEDMHKVGNKWSHQSYVKHSNRKERCSSSLDSRIIYSQTIWSSPCLMIEVSRTSDSRVTCPLQWNEDSLCWMIEASRTQQKEL